VAADPLLPGARIPGAVVEAPMRGAGTPFQGEGSVAVPERALPPLTDEIVRATIERTRR
jgi:hypothetical protein